MPAAGTAAPLQRPGALHLAQLGLELVHAPDKAPAVHFELRLARSPGPDATLLLAQRGTAATQPGSRYRSRASSTCALPSDLRAFGENVQDHRCPVDGGAAEQLLEVPVLRRGHSSSNTTVSTSSLWLNATISRLASTHEGRASARSPLHDAAETRAALSTRRGTRRLLGRHLSVEPGKITPTKTTRFGRVRSMRPR